MRADVEGIGRGAEGASDGRAGEGERSVGSVEMGRRRKESF